MTTHTDTTVELTITLSPAAAEAWAKAETGNDDDVILAAERAIAARLGFLGYPDVDARRTSA